MQKCTPTKRKSDDVATPVKQSTATKRKLNVEATSTKKSRKLYNVDQSVASIMDVVAKSNRKRPFQKIEDGKKARFLMVSWLRAAGSRFSPDKWLMSLDATDHQAVRLAIGPARKKIKETLEQYNVDYFLAGAAGRTVYRLAKKVRVTCMSMKANIRTRTHTVNIFFCRRDRF